MRDCNPAPDPRPVAIKIAPTSSVAREGDGENHPCDPAQGIYHARDPPIGFASGIGRGSRVYDDPRRPARHKPGGKPRGLYLRYARNIPKGFFESRAGPFLQAGPFGREIGFRTMHRIARSDHGIGAVRDARSGGCGMLGLDGDSGDRVDHVRRWPMHNGSCRGRRWPPDVAATGRAPGAAPARPAASLNGRDQDPPAS